MTTLFERMKNTIKADLFDVMEERETNHPISLLNQYLRESENEAKKVEKLVERQYMLKEEFYREWQQAELMVEKRNKQAEIALKAEETALHEMAVQEEELYKEQASRLKAAYDQASNQLVELERKLRDMKHRLKDMNIKRLELMGRENVIAANQKYSTVLDESTFGKSAVRFEETERYMNHLESKAEGGYERSSFDLRMSQLEKELNNAE